MSVLSTLRCVLTWLFSNNDWKSKKHQTILHPLISLVSSLLIFLYSVEKIDSRFDDSAKLNFTDKSRSQIALGIIAYIVLIIACRFKSHGYPVLYEMIWGCNMSMAAAAYAVLKNKPLLLAASMISVSFDQVLWYVDLAGYMLIKKFPVGVAKYLIWPETTFLRKISSFHHIFFIPTCFYVLWTSIQKLPFQGWMISCGMTITLSILARLFTPHCIDTGKEILYLNVNISRELWKDIKISFLQIMDKAPWYFGLPYSNSVWNVLNFISFFILDGLYRSLKYVL